MDADARPNRRSIVVASTEMNTVSFSYSYHSHERLR